DVRAVADLLELRHELPVSPFPADHRSAAFPADVEVAGGQRAAEHDTLRVLADVDEAADADDPVAEAAHVDVALCIDLGERQEREVEPAAIVEIELRRLLDHRREILPAAGIAPGDRGAADDALLVRQMHGVEQAFFSGDRRDAGRYAGAEIADRAGKKLHRASAHDHLPRPERQRLDVFHRYAQLARITRVVVRRVRLPL